jgi:hypothetical protein
MKIWLQKGINLLQFLQIETTTCAPTHLQPQTLSLSNLKLELRGLTCVEAWTEDNLQRKSTTNGRHNLMEDLKRINLRQSNIKSQTTPKDSAHTDHIHNYAWNDVKDCTRRRLNVEVHAILKYIQNSILSI